MDNVFYVGGSTPSSNYKGGITDQQLEWLRQDLSHVAKDKLVIFCAHSRSAAARAKRTKAT